MSAARIRQMEQIRKQESIPSDITDILRKTSPPNIDVIIAVMLNTLRIHAVAITDYIDIVIEKVIQLAEKRGTPVYAWARCCNREDCFTCMGKYDAHYPEIYRKLPNGSQKVIRSRDLVKFLEELGLDQEEIRAFCVAIDVRAGLIKLSNYLSLFYSKLGVVEVHHA